MRTRVEEAKLLDKQEEGLRKRCEGVTCACPFCGKEVLLEVKSVGWDRDGYPIATLIPRGEEGFILCVGKDCAGCHRYVEDNYVICLSCKVAREQKYGEKAVSEIKKEIIKQNFIPPCLEIE
ncbi:MAG: hypothetical protein AAB653_00780 [Patescibacteria group bacterium]